MARRRESRLGAGDVEPDDAVVAPPHRDLGDLARSRLSAHRGEERVHGDRMARGGGPLRPDPEAVDHRADDVIEPELALGVQLRREPDLRVHDTVGREILRTLCRDPHQGLACLHHGQRVIERFEVEDEVLLVRTRHEPLSQLADIFRREAGVAARIRELDDGGGTHSAVEVVVQQGLRRPDQRLEGRAAHANPRSGKSSPRCNQLSSG